MPFEFFDHTGDIGVRVTGASVDDLFADAAMALTATLTDAATVQARETTWIVLEAPSLELLLVDWLNEIVFRFEVAGMLVARTSPRVTRDGDAWKLRAAVEGETLEPGRHRIRRLIKGATYHHLTIVQTDRGVETSVVLDV